MASHVTLVRALVALVPAGMLFAGRLCCSFEERRWALYSYSEPDVWRWSF
jgi:hypothetical protein